MSPLRLFMSALALIIAVPAVADDEFTLVHQRRLRSYLLHVPPGDSDVARPLVMVLHGGGGNAQIAARTSGMSAIADREGFIVVYPNGTGMFRQVLLTWNAGNCCGRALDDQVDDVGFLNAVVDHVADRQRVDRHRVYVTGMSNGGMMAYRLGCETPGRFVAIAPVAGAMNVACQPAVPLSVIAFHGTADQHVLYIGGPPVKTVDQHPRVDTAAPDTARFWAKRDRCRSYGRETVAEVTTERWSDCLGGTAIELVTLQGFGHAWPGGQAGSRRGDDPTASIQASEVMWEFFKRHRR